MTDTQWQAVESLFAECSELAPEERKARVAAISDEVVRREIVSLLEHAGSGEAIEETIGALAGTLHAAERFGPYRVLGRLGQGGQGAVFKAVRDDGAFQQYVAIKVVNWEIDDGTARARLREERQILAGLEHPHIARLLDGGETKTGTPYFAMEFIEGQPLSKAAQGWTTKRKLGLFLEILDAVAFAHRTLIVHRDLKPAKILVTKDGQAKLLDFGIAKLMGTDAAQTLTAYRALSPGYASPEQLRGQAISTSSDVYSLGVVLFELLTGRKPYNFQTTTPAEIDRAVCEAPPMAPKLGDELDHILLMALRKEPERRYGGAAQFADDIRRYLERKPVSARPDTVWYRTRKYAERHWAGLLAAAITLAAICAGAAAALYQAQVAQQRFEQVRRLAHSFVFDYHDELAKLDGSTALREKMVRTALEYIDNLASGAGGDNDLRKELAAAYRKIGDVQGFPGKPNLGHLDQAMASYRKAAGLYERVLAKDPKAAVEVSEFYAAYTALLTNAGNYAGAREMGGKALKRSEENAQARPQDESAQAEVARAWNLLGDVDDETDQQPPALEKYRKAELVANRMLEHWHDETALKTLESTLSRVAPQEQAAGRLKEAEAALARDEGALKELLQIAPLNPQYRRSHADLNQFWSQLFSDDLLPSYEDAARGLPYARRMLELARQNASRDSDDVGAKFTLAVALYRDSYFLKFSDAESAVREAREAVQLFDRQIAAGGKKFLPVSRRARALLRLSEALLAAHQPGEARLLAAQAFTEEQAVAAREDPKLPFSTRMVAALLAQAKWDEALQLAQKIHSTNPADLRFAIPLARVEEAQAEYARRAGDEARARHWKEEIHALWTAFPQQSEFVKRQLQKN